MMYTVAMLKKDNDLQLVTIRRGVMTSRYKEDLKVVEDLQNDGYVLESCIMTNKREVFYKNKLKGRIAEYINYLETSANARNDVVERHGATSKVYEDTMTLIYAHRATLRKQVAMCAIRCLDLGVPINEFAMDCVYDYNLRLF